MGWWQRVESCVIAFLSSTSIHGPSYTVDFSNSRAVRLLWMAAVIVGFVFAGVFLADLFAEWEAHPIINAVGQDVPVTELKVRKCRKIIQWKVTISSAVSLNYRVPG